PSRRCSGSISRAEVPLRRARAPQPWAMPNPSDRARPANAWARVRRGWLDRLRDRLAAARLRALADLDGDDRVLDGRVRVCALGEDEAIDAGYPAETEGPGF
ncbi:MAG TPA: hypothetical protein VMT88_05600, partial [Actinomycetes bacterium]|nr:hypothetical protein [Actinomycetes bacterium]